MLNVNGCRFSLIFDLHQVRDERRALFLLRLGFGIEILVGEVLVQGVALYSIWLLLFWLHRWEGFLLNGGEWLGIVFGKLFFGLGLLFGSALRH